MKTVEFSALIGETVKTIEGAKAGSEQVTLETESGRSFRFYHEPGCCESVQLNEVVGNVDDLIGSPITMAEESSNSDDKPEDADSWTWTFYRLATLKGYVTMRWLGESNGYYAEDVTFEEVR